MAKTQLYKEENKGHKIIIIKKGTIECFNIQNRIVIGRQTEDNHVDIDLSQKYVSRQHGEFSIISDSCTYKDLGSRNGTFHNGRKLSANTTIELKHGDVLNIFNGTPHYYNDVVVLIYLTDFVDEFQDETIFLKDDVQEITIGRDCYEGIRLSDETISKKHAIFYCEDGRWIIEDNNSTNGLYLNNIKITKPIYLQIGDCIRISNLVFVFLGDRIIFQNNLSLQQDGVKTAELKIQIKKKTVRSLFKKKTLLKDIDVVFKSGEMILILGGSGAGKTTFMNAVLGYEKASGTITYNNVDVYKDFVSLKNILSFVPQSDLMRDSDTVYYTLKNAAQMKLSDISSMELETKVLETLKTFNLSARTNTLVKSLSGGERKRLSIAIEYIANPDVFFMDEPDSGIDGDYSKEMMQIMRRIADQGKIIVVISHSPNRIAENFDKVLVLAKSQEDNCGYVSFFGSVTESYSFFDTKDLESIVGIVNSHPNYYIEKYRRYIV